VNSVKLRPGAASPGNVKLYPWTSAGALAITEIETGSGVELVRIDKNLIVADSGAGSESIQKVIYYVKVVEDSGAGTEALVVARSRVEEKEIDAALEVFIGRIRDLKKLQAIIRVYATIIDEGRLSVSGALDRLVDAYVYPAGAVENLRSVETAEDHPVNPRLGSDQKTPKGYSQGHKSFTVRLYTLGRNTILDALLDEDGDNAPFECIDVRCLDKYGRPANLFIENGTIAAADPVIRDRADVVYRYTIRCGKFGMRPNIGVLRMTSLPVSAPMTINITHPTIREIESDYSTLFEKEELEMGVISVVAVSEGAAHKGALVLESEYSTSTL